MHVTLHLTTSCNFRCSYCYAAKTGNEVSMTMETARQAVDFAADSMSGNVGIIFFGGEPLLHKELIRETVEYCNELSAKTPGKYRFYFKITTNGLLLDQEFMMFALDNNITVSLSIDGIKEAHDMHRKTAGGQPTHDIIVQKAGMLLSWQPYANAFMVVSPETVQYYYQSVKYLIEKGFRYIIASINYAGIWQQHHLEVLKKQYRLLAAYYKELTLNEKKFFFSPFEMKLSTHIKGKDMLCTDCHLGQKQVSVAPSGDIYPCVQFVQDDRSNRKFVIGHVSTGFDEAKRMNLYKESQVPPGDCERCAVKSRCNYRCSCLNWQTGGIINIPSPVLCETERMIIPIVDKLGAELFRKKAPAFIHKHYNTAYPVFSLMEDKRLGKKLHD